MTQKHPDKSLANKEKEIIEKFSCSDYLFFGKYVKNVALKEETASKKIKCSLR